MNTFVRSDQPAARRQLALVVVCMLGGACYVWSLPDYYQADVLVRLERSDLPAWIASGPGGFS